MATTEIGSETDLAEKLPSGVPAPIVVRQNNREDGREDDAHGNVDDPDEGPDPFIGRVLAGLYKVEYKIGEGGMGTVYAALHVHLNKHFAVKVLSSRIASDKQAVERLRQEAVAASSIDHDNIVNVVSFDTSDDGDVFIVMELLKGMSLADVLEKGAMPLERALHMSIQIARALHAAHEAGIVHRDLKPENIFIVRKGDHDFVKVLDFGISKVKSADTEQVRMTKTGQLVGTPLYMSPEQARGEADIDRRVDIYALGVILYEMLTGLPPFDGGNYFQLLWKHGNEAPIPPSEKCPDADIPPAVEATILKALAKLPSERYATMAELEDALIAAAGDAPPPAHLASMPSMPSIRTRATLVDSMISAVPTSRGPSKVMLGVAAVVLVVAMVGIGFVLSQDPAADGADDPSIAGTAGANHVANDVDETDPDLDPDPDPDPRLPQGVDVDEVPPSATVSVSFLSRPEGATVRVAGRDLGVTPLVAPLPRQSEPIDVTFSLPRHVDERVSVVPAEGARVEGRLRPIRRNNQSTETGVMFKMSF